MSILSLPNELLCYIVEEFLREPADVFALLRGSNRCLAPALTALLNSYAIRYEHALNATLWAAFHQHRDLLSMLIREGKGIRICHPPYLPQHAAHEELLDYAMENSRRLRVRNCPYNDCTMLQWAISSLPHVRLERVGEIVRSGVLYGEEAFAQMKWGPSGYDCDEDIRDELDSATLDLLLRHLPVGKLSEIFNGLRHLGVNPILEASVAGHRRVVELLLKYGVHPDVEDDASGMTALHLAARSGHIEVAGILLEHAADIEHWDFEMKTPLHHAILMKQREMVEFLVSDGAPLGEQDMMGNTLLGLAVESGDHGIVETLVLHGADVEGEGRGGLFYFPGLRPIHIATELGYENVVDVLVRQGADIEAPSIGGTPLMIATSMGHDEVVRLLIGNGANMYPINHMGATLMHTAAQEGHERTVLALAESMGQEAINSRDYWGDTPMHVAVYNGHVGVVEVLFRLGADVNAVRGDGGSPLTIAASMGDPEAVSTLLNLGAHVRPQDGRVALEGKSLYVACRIMKEIEKEPNPDFQSRWVLQSELGFAAEHGHLGYAGLLVKRGADPTIRDYEGGTPLNRALKSYCLPIVRLLLERTVNVNSFDAQGNTPLHLAVERNHSCDTISKLLLMGADPNIRNNKGSTPFHLAAAGLRALVLIPLMVERSRTIDLDLQDLSGRTVLNIISGYPSVKKRLYQYLISMGASENHWDRRGRFASYRSSIS